jgi:hypothetical protein
MICLSPLLLYNTTRASNLSEKNSISVGSAVPESWERATTTTTTQSSEPTILLSA